MVLGFNPRASLGTKTFGQHTQLFQSSRRASVTPPTPRPTASGFNSRAARVSNDPVPKRPMASFNPRAPRVHIKGGYSILFRCFNPRAARRGDAPDVEVLCLVSILARRLRAARQVARNYLTCKAKFHVLRGTFYSGNIYDVQSSYRFSAQ